ncbi:hypothetical protein [Brevibacillus laterosporus]|uniref:hypothetical protein n=1 Tax=Brevibacillus laterosporus TaxID=1465 RepID=UPI000EB02C2F|nr:hypothetical protein [Brevibacillus laterosporus]AYK07735.1 hypothetical protein D8Z77_15915 [Brevibacillus laterosporus]
MNLTITRHAIREAVKDLHVSRQEAEAWIRTAIDKARFISDIISEKGNPSRLYGYKGFAIILDATEDVVVTVYKNETPKASIRNRINEFVTKELRKITRTESALARKISLSKAELTVEKAELELRMIKTKSIAVKLACQARINAINEYFTQLDNDLLTIKHEKRSVAKTVAAYA